MAAMASEKSRTLHNFSLPPRLSWGTHRLLRCSNDAVSLPSSNPQNAAFHSPPPPPLHQNDNNNNSHPIGIIREKLILDLRSEVEEQFRANFIENTDFTPPPPPPPPEPRPWNLRARRSPATAGIATINKTNASSSSSRKKRVKFSVPLSRKEVEDDFVRITGKRPSRKPKKHPSRLQKELDDLFPGTYLQEVTPEMYKVYDAS